MLAALADSGRTLFARTRRWFQWTAAFAFAVLLLGCASAPSVVLAPPPAQPTLESLITQGGTLQNKDEHDKAFVVFETAARSYPTAKEPWLRIAQMHFGLGNHGAAIVAAQEALQRDPTDVTARSIVAVAGLRVSAAALKDLRRSEAVVDPYKSEAEKLVQTMRETLGQTVLVAPVAPATPAVEPSAAPRAAAARAVAAGAAPAAPAARASEIPKTTSRSEDAPRKPGNPFSALR
jgi:tetratricopeptide (TPR) repeat protein